MTAAHRIESLDLMRGLAALFVAVSHFFIYQEIWSTGFEAISVLAVEVFFVLSGFVLAPQIIACVQAGRARPVAIFLVRRWMRTVPPFLVALACMSALTPNLQIGDLVRYGLYVQNLFSQSNHYDYFPVAWSLSVEEWFYLTFPALLVAAGALQGRTDIRFISTMTALFIGVISAWPCLAGDYDHWGYE